MDFVAATDCSRPAISGSNSSASVASGESISLTMAMVVAPALRADRCISTMSGLRPDCEMETAAARARRSRAP